MTLYDVIASIIRKHSYCCSLCYSDIYETVPDKIAHYLKDAVYNVVVGFDDPLANRIFNFLTTLPIFTRLHNTYQLSLTYTLYPTARHTRFDHCILTSLLCYKFTKSLYKICEDEERKNSLEICSILDEKDPIVAMMIGLLHDVGHPGLGHVLDALAGRLMFYMQKISSKLGVNPDLQILIGTRKPKLDVALALFLILFCNQLREALNYIGKELSEYANIDLRQIEFARIIAYILSGEEFPPYPELRNNTNFELLRRKTMLLRSIYDEPLDLDRIDYLCRDTYFLPEEPLPIECANPEKVSDFKELKKRYREGICEQFVNSLVSLDKSAVEKYVDFRSFKLREYAGTRYEEIRLQLRKLLYELFYEGFARSLLDTTIARVVLSVAELLLACSRRFTNELPDTSLIVHYLLLPTLESSNTTLRLIDILLSNEALVQRFYIEFLVNVCGIDLRKATILFFFHKNSLNFGMKLLENLDLVIRQLQEGSVRSVRSVDNLEIRCMKLKLRPGYGVYIYAIPTQILLETLHDIVCQYKNKNEFFEIIAKLTNFISDLLIDPYWTLHRITNMEIKLLEEKGMELLFITLNYYAIKNVYTMLRPLTEGKLISSDKLIEEALKHIAKNPLLYVWTRPGIKIKEDREDKKRSDEEELIGKELIESIVNTVKCNIREEILGKQQVEDIEPQS